MGNAAAPEWLGRRLGWAVAAVVTSGLFMAWWLHWFDLVDLQVYRAGALALLHGQDIYLAHPAHSGLPFTYPPFAAVAFIPLAVLPDLAARVVMSLASAAALVAAVLAALRLVAPGWPSRSRWAVALAVCAATPLFEPLRDTFRLGQVNIILMALVMTDLVRRRRVPDRDGRDGPAGGSGRGRRDGPARGRGVLIGLATAIKLTPAIFILYLLVTRRTREAVTALGVAAGATLVGVVALPSASVHYWTQLVFDDGRIGRPGNVWNQSVRGALARLSGSPDRAQVLWLIAALGLLFAGLALAGRYHRSGDELLAIGAAAMTGLLISPISWNHHWVWALPAAIGLWQRALVTRRAAYVGVAAGWTAVFALASMSWWTFDGRDNYHLGGLQNIEAACYVLAAIALFALLAWPGSGWPSARLTPLDSSRS